MIKQKEEDDDFNTSIILSSLKKDKDVLQAKKDKATKSKEEAKAKVEQPLKDNNKMKLMH